MKVNRRMHLFGSWLGVLVFLIASPQWANGQAPSPSNNINLASNSGYSNSPLGRTVWDVAFRNQLTTSEQEKLFYFDDWNTTALINGKRSIRNVNFSLYDQALVFKVSSDTVYQFNEGAVNQFVIRQKKFKKFYLGSEKGNGYLEVLYEAPDGKTQLLKRHYVSVSEARADPLMLNKDKLNITRLMEYYLAKGKDYPIKIKLSKKELLKHFSDKSTELVQIAKQNKLSFKRDADVIKMLTLLEQEGEQ